MLKASLGNQEGVPANAYVISFASPDEGAANADLVLFLYLVPPAPELRNAERIRPWPGLNDPPRLLEPAVPLELHFLLTVGAGAPAGGRGPGPAGRRRPRDRSGLAACRPGGVPGNGVALAAGAVVRRDGADLGIVPQ